MSSEREKLLYEKNKELESVPRRFAWWRVLIIFLKIKCSMVFLSRGKIKKYLSHISIRVSL